MKKILIGTLFAAFAVAATAAPASAEVVIRTGHHHGHHYGYRHHERHAVVIRERVRHHHDRGLHRGWSHARHGGVKAKVVVR